MAKRGVGTGVIDLELGTSKLQRGVAGVRGTMTKLGGAIKIGLVGATVAAGALALALRKAAQAAAVQEKAEAKLAAVQRATGNATGYTTKQLYAQARALQQVTTYGDEVIISAQAILATFKSIKGELFRDATEAILDMATVLDTDLRTAAVQLGKALGDPIRGVTALGRAGVDFTNKEREVIRVLAESGRMYEAQNLILKQVEGQMAGLARAQAQTFSGRRTQAANRWGDAMERIGSAFEPAFAKAVETLEALGTAAERNAIGFAKWADKIGSVVEALALLPDERERAAAGLGAGGWLGTQWGKVRMAEAAAMYGLGAIMPFGAGDEMRRAGQAQARGIARPGGPTLTSLMIDEAEYLQQQAAIDRHQTRQPPAQKPGRRAGATFTGRLRGMLGWAGRAGGGMRGLAGMLAEGMGGGIAGMPTGPAAPKLGGFEGGAGMWQRIAAAGVQATDPAMRTARAQEAALDEFKRMVALLERIAEGKSTTLFGGVQNAISGLFAPKTPAAVGE